MRGVVARSSRKADHETLMSWLIGVIKKPRNRGLWRDRNGLGQGRMTQALDTFCRRRVGCCYVFRYFRISEASYPAVRWRAYGKQFLDKLGQLGG